MILRKFLIRQLLIFYFTLSSAQVHAEASASTKSINVAANRKHSVALYFGPGSPSPFVDIARIRGIELTADYIISAAFAHRLWADLETFAFELEFQLTKHLEHISLFSTNGAIVVRWYKTPWSNVVDSSFAFGNGLSYANGIPNLEASRLPKTSKLLYHFLIEAAFPFMRSSAYEAFFRVSHRSGGFGLFDGVVGGSDFLCLGLRYRF